MGRFFITTPIYYVNDAPHIGHAYTTVVADSLARWHRMKGDQVFFLTGTDEHGLKVARSAQAAGMEPAAWAELNAKRFEEAWGRLGITNDDFIRTTEERHHRSVQAFLSAIRANGYIELRNYEGPYCVSCEDYYTDFQAPDGICPIHKVPLERFSEENYFFLLSKFQDRLEQLYRDRPDFVLPEAKRNEALGILRGGLQDVSISRTSFSWGVPVPWDSRHVFYVWYDALVNYVTAIGYGEDPERFREWWPEARHLIGKEIIRFHCIWWPAMCMAAGIDPPRQIFVHGHLLVGGEKMSKTAFNQISPNDLVAEFGSDAVRYQLLREPPLGADGDFSYEGMVARYNSDLANNLGNLLSRVTTLVQSRFGPSSPPASGKTELQAVAEEVSSTASLAWDGWAPHVALEATWRLIKEANAVLEAREPWKASEADAAATLGDALEALRIVAVLAAPAVPEAASAIMERIGLADQPVRKRGREALAFGQYPGGLQVERGPALFPRHE
jgi:methionyl-tRNA synthetase